MRYIIGIDCAAQHKKCGIALGAIAASGATIQEVGTGYPDVVEVLKGWVTQYQPVLLALDAPLGWPALLGSELVSHEAGAGISSMSDELFHRTTDDFVKMRLRKKPLEVGADKIARAAVTALKIVDQLRNELSLELPLLWHPSEHGKTGIIEVYPAATLISRGLSEKGYKGNDAQNIQRRGDLIASLSESMDIDVSTHELLASDDALDAVLCVLAGVDFLQGKVWQPEDRELARKEGWIWFRKEDS